MARLAARYQNVLSLRLVMAHQREGVESLHERQLLLYTGSGIGGKFLRKWASGTHNQSNGFDRSFSALQLLFKDLKSANNAMKVSSKSKVGEVLTGISLGYFLVNEVYDPLNRVLCAMSAAFFKLNAVTMTLPVRRIVLIAHFTPRFFISSQGHSVSQSEQTFTPY